MAKRILFLTVFLLLCQGFMPLIAANVDDKEPTVNQIEPWNYHIQAIYSGSGLRIIQFKLGVLAHFSYLLISDAKALVVDPGRDIDAYLNFAAAEKVAIIGTLLTHSHADFIAGHREMAIATGAPIYASHNSGALFPHVEVKENDVIKVGSAQLKIIETPGHTVDSLCAIVGPIGATETPEFLLSGDALWVGGPGRPDLMNGALSVAYLAGLTFDTWNNKLAKLSDSLIVLPAHGAGIFCGTRLSEIPATTIGQEKQTNPYLGKMNNRNDFIVSFIAGLEPAPWYFKENTRINRNGPDLVDWQNPAGNKLESLTGLLEQRDIYVIDVRDAALYKEKHAPRSVNIPLQSSFESLISRLIPFRSRVILFGENAEIFQAAKRLRRVGYQIEHMLFSDYLAAGEEVVALPILSAEELQQNILAGSAPLLIDVRAAAEFASVRIANSINLPLNGLEEQANLRLDPDQSLVIIGDDSVHANVAAGLLQHSGFKHLQILVGGVDSWTGAGFQVIRRESGAATAQFQAVALSEKNIPQQLTADELGRLLITAANSLVLYDIRSKEDFADYSIPGAINIPIAELVNAPGMQGQGQTVVVVDRDGKSALAVAGALMALRPQKVVTIAGGLEAFWRANQPGLSQIGLMNVSPTSADAKVIDSSVVTPVTAESVADKEPREQAIREESGDEE